MQDKDTKNSAFNQLFLSTFNQKLFTEIIESGADNYSKKLKTTQLIKLIAYAEMNNQNNLREISSNFLNTEFQNTIGLESISHSQISRRSNSLPVTITQLLFKIAASQLKLESGINNLPKDQCLHLIDATTIGLCLNLFPWATFRKSKSGIKIHLRLIFCKDMAIPDQVEITNAKTSDKRKMNELVVESKDAMHVFDRAYVDYKKFDDYCEKGIFFTSRLKDNALVEIIKENKVESNAEILRDAIVILGDNKTRMVHPLRMIELLDSNGRKIRIITNNFDLEAEAVAEIYRHRWQIELFFKWLNQHFRVKHFYGTSETGVYNQIYIAMATYCLLQLLKLRTGTKKTLLELNRVFNKLYYQSFEELISVLNRPPTRKSKGRQKKTLILTG